MSPPQREHDATFDTNDEGGRIERDCRSREFTFASAVDGHADGTRRKEELTSWRLGGGVSLDATNWAGGVGRSSRDERFCSCGLGLALRLMQLLSFLLLDGVDRWSRDFESAGDEGAGIFYREYQSYKQAMHHRPGRRSQLPCPDDFRDSDADAYHVS
jgi:hypothetical protein